MRLLVVTTKPPWPPRDGGRRVVWEMLQALARTDVEVALLAPRLEATEDDIEAMRAVCEPTLPPLRVRPAWAVAADALRHPSSLGLLRHRHAAMQHALARLLDAWQPDVVHAEQLQAWINCGPALAAGVPAVLRAQNVESALWMQRRDAVSWIPCESSRLRRDEADAVATAALTLAITERDADALRALVQPAVGDRVRAWRPMFALQEEAGPPCEGEPALAAAGSAGWWPNRQATAWLLREAMPAVLRRLPRARLHVFGGDIAGAVPGVRFHPAPSDSSAAFPAGAIAVVPLFAGSGIRLRILEAWARGLPVVASPMAAAGLEARDGVELLIAEGADAFAAAIERLHREPALRRALVAAGRDHLARRHDPLRQTQALLMHWEEAARRGN